MDETEQTDTKAESAALLEQYLAASSDECPLCGYNLHRLRGNTCPECGRELELRIAVREPRRAAFYTGLIGFAAGAGFALLLSGYVVVMTIITVGRGGPELWEVGLLFAKGAVLLALCLVWIRNARRIQKQPPLAQWLLAFGAWATSIGAMVLFFSIVST